MKVLLITDIPPCREFTGGMVIESLVRFFSENELAICSVVNSHINPKIPSDLHSIPSLFLKKPREQALKISTLKIVNKIIGFCCEYIQQIKVKYCLAKKIASFAKEQNVQLLWVLLEGQTMVRLAHLLPNQLDIPLYTQVHDPFELWLRANDIDSLTQRLLLKKFDKTLLKSAACATASWAMSEYYEKKYNIFTQPVIASLASDLTCQPATKPHDREEFIISIAGQIYATEEWQMLLNALNKTNWIIANRKVRLRVLSTCFQAYAQQPFFIEYMGWQPQNETIRLLADSDLLYLPYWFSPVYLLEATYSFPSKLISYFASGRPVLCHSPLYASPAKYLVKNNAGFICDSLNPDDILKQLENVILNRDEYAIKAKNATECFRRDFTLEKMKESFFKVLDYYPKKTMIR